MQKVKARRIVRSFLQSCNSAILPSLYGPAQQLACGRVRIEIARGDAIDDRVELSCAEDIAFEAPHEPIGYQLAQSEFAMATGGLFGSGLGQGHPGLIPFAATDFVFAAIGEELGLLGATAVLLLYVTLVALMLVVPGLVVPTFTRIFVDDFLIGGHQWMVKPLLWSMGLTVILYAALTWLQEALE